MTEEHALQALAAVDRFRQAGAAAAEAIELLVEAMAANGHSQRMAYAELGLTAVVAQWAAKQRGILEHGDEMQRQVLMELLEADDDDDRPTAGELETLILRWCAS